MSLRSTSTLLTGADNDPYPEHTQQPIDHPYAKGYLAQGAAIGSNASESFVLNTAGYSKLFIGFRMTAGAATDLNTAVNPYEPDGATVFNTAGSHLTSERSQAAALTSGSVYMSQQYDLHGIDQVQVWVQNVNAAAQTLTVYYYLQK